MERRRPEEEGRGAGEGGRGAPTCLLKTSHTPVSHTDNKQQQQSLQQLTRLVSILVDVQKRQEKKDKKRRAMKSECAKVIVPAQQHTRHKDTTDSGHTGVTSGAILRWPGSPPCNASVATWPAPGRRTRAHCLCPALGPSWA